MRRVVVSMAMVGALVALGAPAGAAPDPVRVTDEGDVVITGTDGVDEVFVAAEGPEARFFVNDYSLLLDDFDGDVTIVSRDGDDVVSVVGVAGDLVVSTGGGSDSVGLADDFGGEVRVITGGGDDDVLLGYPLIGATFDGSLVVNLGSGDDTLQFQLNTSGPKLLANGQSGQDELVLAPLGRFDVTELKSFELCSFCD